MGGDSFPFDKELPVASPEANTEPLAFSSLEQERFLSLAGAGVLSKVESLGDNFSIAALSDGKDEGVQERTVETLERLSLPPETTQMVVVTSSQWDATMGTLSLYERKNGKKEHWQFTGETWPVELGHKGMAWGKGLVDSVENQDAAVVGKREGDQKAPAGVFSLGPAFGYEQDAPAGVKMKYLQAGERDFFVDDPNSPDYNSWVRLPENDEPGKHWQSFEKMKRDDQRYKLGLVVEHNMNPAIPGDGSAIFLHVWKEPGTGTAGCTSMSEGNMRELLRWLEPGKKPLLMQIPTQAMREL